MSIAVCFCVCASLWTPKTPNVELDNIFGPSQSPGPLIAVIRGASFPRGAQIKELCCFVSFPVPASQIISARCCSNRCASIATTLCVDCMCCGNRSGNHAAETLRFFDHHWPRCIALSCVYRCIVVLAVCRCLLLVLLYC